jgi:anti-sigma-K factor RskA
MWRWKKNNITNEQLNRFSNEVFDALHVSESEINATAQSPFLLRRIQVRIEAEARRRAEANNPWQLWLLTFKQAVPAMALLALVAVGSLWALNDTNGGAPESDTAAVLLATDNVSDEDVSAALGWQSR